MAIDLRNGKVKGLIFKLAIPAMLAQFVNVLYNIVDRIFISNMPEVGELALAGVGICAPILILISAFSYLSSLGGGPLMAIALGRRDKEDAQNIFSTCISLLFIISITLTIFLLVFLDPILYLFGASDVLIEYARPYMQVYVSGATIGIFALGLNTFISSQGFSKQAMISVSLGALTNIVFDYVFIYVCNLGVAGAAGATVLGQVVSLIYAITFFLGKHSNVKLGLKFNWAKMKRILRMGFPLFIIATTDGIIVIILNAVLQRFGGVNGDKLITVATIATATFQIVAMPLAGISAGCQSLLSYNLGAEQFDRVKVALKWDYTFCFIFCLISFLIFQLFPEPFAMIFTRNPEMVELSSKFIRIYTFGLLTLGFQYAATDALTALALPKPALFLSLHRNILCCASAIILPFIFQAEAAFFAEPIADILGGTMALIITYFAVKHLFRDHGYYKDEQKTR